jgi:hypothetical protein
MLARAGVKPIGLLAVIADSMATRPPCPEPDGTDRRDGIGALAAALVRVREALDLADARTAEHQEERAAQRRMVDELAQALSRLAGGDLTQPIA